jgi:hypothetical protein
MFFIFIKRSDYVKLKGLKIVCGMQQFQLPNVKNSIKKECPMCGGKFE